MSNQTCAFLIIGNEILSGRTQDKNLAVLAEKLVAKGVTLAEVRIVRDEKAAIIQAVQALSRAYDYVMTSGGIGPTHDDITSACIAEAFAVALHRDPAAVAMLASHYTPEDLNAARLKMADVPKGSTLIENPVSKAPGFRVQNVFVMAGVPRIFTAMLDNVLLSLQDGDPVLSRTVSTLKGEGTIAEILSAVQARHTSVEIGSYPYFRQGQIGVSLVLRSTDPDLLDTAAIDLEQALARLDAPDSDTV